MQKNNRRFGILSFDGLLGENTSAYTILKLIAGLFLRFARLCLIWDILFKRRTISFRKYIIYNKRNNHFKSLENIDFIISA